MTFPLPEGTSGAAIVALCGRAPRARRLLVRRDGYLLTDWR
jgi:hypothetical protein